MAKATKQQFVFRGGVNTATERALLPSGAYSWKQNLRDTHPGFVTRKGQTRIHTTTDTAQEILTLYQYIDKAGTKHCYAQRADGAVHKSTSAWPTAIAGNFGTQLIAAPSDISNLKPASWAELQDYCVFTDNTRFLGYSGTTQRISSFIVHESATAPAAIPTQGEDFTDKVTDNDTSRLADLDAFGTNATDTIFIGTQLPADTINWTVDATNKNTNASVVTIKYYKNGTGFSTVGAVTDTTKDGGASGTKTLNQSGSMSWTAPSDEIPHYQFGRNLYWYQITVSAALAASVDVTQVTYESNDFTTLQNVWDGVFVPAVIVQTDRATGSGGDEERWFNEPAGAARVGGLAANKYMYIGCVEPIVGFYVDVGNTPNIVYTQITASADAKLTVNATSNYISWGKARFTTDGLEEGMSVTTANFTTGGNNITNRIKRLTSDTLYWDDSVSGLTAESDDNATITYDVTPVAMTVERFNGKSWVDCSETDGTEAFTKSGFITFLRATDHPFNFNNIGFNLYWYRIKLDKQISRNCVLSFETMPYYDMGDFGRGRTCVSWKDRIVASFDKWPSYAYAGLNDTVTRFNGEEYGILRAGDGRANDICAMQPFVNELLVLQIEQGVEGGCTTLFEGKNPPTYGKLLISSRIGGMNAKSLAVVEDVLSGPENGQEYKKIAFWLSREGIMASDSRYIQNISKPIANYFNPKNSEYINLAQTNKMWLAYDAAYKCIRIGLVSGSSTTNCNVYPVLDLEDMTWGFDTFAQNLSCLINAQASDNKSVIQVAGGATDGFVYQSNSGTSDNGTAINDYCDREIDGEGYVITIPRSYFRCKTQSSGNITRTVATDTATPSKHSETIPMAARTSGDGHKRFKCNKGTARGDHITFRYQGNVLNQSMTLLDDTYIMEISDE